MNAKYIFLVLLGLTLSLSIGMYFGSKHNKEKKALQTTIETQNKELHRAAAIVDKERERQYEIKRQIINKNEARKKEIMQEMEYYAGEIRRAKREYEMAEKMYNEVTNKVTLRFKKQREDREYYYQEAVIWRDRAHEYKGHYDRLNDELNRLN